MVIECYYRPFIHIVVTWKADIVEVSRHPWRRHDYTLRRLWLYKTQSESPYFFVRVLFSSFCVSVYILSCNGYKSPEMKRLVHGLMRVFFLFLSKSRGGRLVDGRGELFFGLCIPYWVLFNSYN